MSDVPPARTDTLEAGFTIIEVMVAAMIAVLVIGASALLFSKGSASSLASQRQSEVVAVADQQIEQIRQQLKTNPNGFSALALSGAPAAGTNSIEAGNSATHTDPNDFVVSAAGCGSSNAGYMIQANYDNTTEGVDASVPVWAGCPTGAEPLVVRSGGIVSPQTAGVTVGSDTATVYRYVTDTYVGCSSWLGSCTSAAGDVRRVTVAVIPDNHGRSDIGPNSPLYLTTTFANPVPTNQVNSSIGLTIGASIG
jgi:Tfp pilus assembly protein PilV